MKRKYRIYRLLLYLYPKSFRAHYGEEMVHVLDDLLAEEHNFIGRFVVWVRIGSELPFSIAQENIDNFGGKSMNLIVLKKNRNIILAGVVGFLLAIGLLSATVLRDRLSVHVINIVYGKSMKDQFGSYNTELGNPVGLLSNGNATTSQSCNLIKGPGISTQVVCEVNTSYYTKTKDIGSKEEVLKRVDTIQAKLKEQQYKGVGNDVTLKSLVEGTYEGKDYTSDASYMKTIGKYNCVYSTTVAYANPAEPAINTMHSCVRTFNL